MLRFDQTGRDHPALDRGVRRRRASSLGHALVRDGSSCRARAAHRARARRLHRPLARRSLQTVTSGRVSTPSAYRIAAPPPTQAYGASGPTWADDFARWGLFVSLALLLGSSRRAAAGASRAAARPAVEAAASLCRVGAFAAIDVGIAAFILRAEDALQLPFVDLMYGDLSPFATKTRFGVAFVAMTLGFALVAALVFLSWLLDAPRAALAGVPDRARLRVGPLAVGPLGGRAELVMVLPARRLPASVGGVAVGRRARDARVRRVAARARAAAHGVSRLLPTRDRARRRARGRRDVPDDPAAARGARPLVGQLRTCRCSSSWPSWRSRSRGAPRTTSSSDRGSSAETRRVAVCAGVSSGEMSVALGGAARRRDPRQLGAAAAARRPVRRRRHRPPR